MSGRSAGRVLAVVGAALCCVVSLLSPMAVGASATPATGYVALSPSRVLDTRAAVGAPKAKVRPGGTVVLQVGGRGGVPSTGVAAVALNVTVTGPTASSFVTVFPTGASRPVASNLNFGRGQTLAALVVAKLGSGGKVSLYNLSGSVDLIADVAGYWTTGSDFTAVSPARLLDTRSGLGAAKKPLGDGATLSLLVAGRGGVPASGVTAVALNVTAVAPSKSGFLTVFPTGAARPTASNVNFVARQTIANLTVAKLGSGGKVSVYNRAGAVNVVADVAGYWTSGGGFTALTPARQLDTRAGVGAYKAKVGAGHTIDLQVTGRGGVPASGVGAVVLNVTVTGPSASTYLTAWPAGTARPTASNLNVVAGATTPNLVFAKVGAGGKVSLFNYKGSADIIADVAGWFAGEPAPLAVGYDELVSARPDGLAAPGYGDAAALSPDGRFVLFDNGGSDVLPHTPYGGTFLRDTHNGTTTLVMAHTESVSFWGMAMSNDAQRILVDRYNYDDGTEEGFVYDTSTHALTSLGVPVTDGDSIALALSGDGRYAVFASNSANLGGPTDGAYYVYERDLTTSATQFVGHVGESGGQGADVSDDGRYVTYLDEPAYPDPSQIMRWDRNSGTAALVSVSPSAVAGNDQSWGPSISADGSLIAFASAASNLVTGDTNAVADAFVRDMDAGTTSLVSRTKAGGLGSGDSFGQAVSSVDLSRDGSTVVFGSYATNMVAGLQAGLSQAYRRDLDSGALSVVSATAAGAPGDGETDTPLDPGSANPIVSPDGAWVAFSSNASNLVPGTVNHDYFVALRRVQ